MALAAVFAVCAILPSTALAGGGDLAVSVSYTPSGPITVGQSVTFVVAVKNLSSVTAESVLLTEVLPGNSYDPRLPSPGRVQWVSQSFTNDPGWYCFAQLNAANPGDEQTPPYNTGCGLDGRDMAGGESFSLTITGRANRAGRAVNYAGAGSSHNAYDPASNTSGPVDDDPNQSNNDVSTTFQIVEGAGSVRRGDKRNNTLRGGSGRDSLFGQGGNDILKGLGGNDHLDGGPGNDNLDGGPGNDTLLGGPGKDVIRGGAGKDGISAGPGRDTVASADGVKETVNCGPGKDTVTADSNDRLLGCEIRHLRH
jgi:Ca2+-binding RTX toxin-like protein